jgi:hypothetical protein
MQGYNSKTKNSICQPNMLSAIRPVAHGHEIPMSTPPETLETSDPDFEYYVSDCDVDFQPTATEP